MKTRVFIRHCLRDFEIQSRFWKRIEKITKNNKWGNKDQREAQQNSSFEELWYHITINEDEYSLSDVVHQMEHT